MSVQLQQRQKGLATEGTGKEGNLHFTSQGKELPREAGSHGSGTAIALCQETTGSEP